MYNKYESMYNTMSNGLLNQMLIALDRDTQRIGEKLQKFKGKTELNTVEVAQFEELWNQYRDKAERVLAITRIVIDREKKSK